MVASNKATSTESDGSTLPKMSVTTMSLVSEKAYPLQLRESKYWSLGCISNKHSDKVLPLGEVVGKLEGLGETELDAVIVMEGVIDGVEDHDTVVEGDGELVGVFESVGVAEEVFVLVGVPEAV